MNWKNGSDKSGVSKTPQDVKSFAQKLSEKKDLHEVLQEEKESTEPLKNNINQDMFKSSPEEEKSIEIFLNKMYWNNKK